MSQMTIEKARLVVEAWEARERAEQLTAESMEAWRVANEAAGAAGDHLFKRKEALLLVQAADDRVILRQTAGLSATDEPEATEATENKRIM